VPIRVTGGSWPAQIWHDFMAAAHEGVAVHDFAVPLDLPPLPSPDPPAPAGEGAPFVDVVDVVGMPIGPALRLLATAGFAVERVDVASGEVEPGVVVSQDPVGGAVTRAGTRVTVQVAATGLAPADVPSVVGLTEEDARAAVEAIGLVADVERAPPPAPADAGLVWKQSPPAGTSVPTGTRVTLRVVPE
jgi:serine/threonine-protein kinase